MKGYPKWFQGFIIATSIVLFITGCLLVPTTLDLRMEWDMPWRLTIDQRFITVTLHTLFSYIMLCLFGAIWRIHIITGLRQKKNLYSGLTLIGIIIALTLTGIAIFYLGHDMASMLASIFHLILGLIIFFFFIYHIFIGKNLGKKNRFFGNNVN